MLIASAARLSMGVLLGGPTWEDPWLSVLPSRAVWLYRRWLSTTDPVPLTSLTARSSIQSTKPSAAQTSAEGSIT